jgi:hypothetical protein
LQLLIKIAGQPARSSLPRPMELHLFEPYLYPKPGGEVRQLPIRGKQCQRHSPFPILIENFDRSAPALALSVVDLSKVKDLPLDILVAPATAIFDDVPITMNFAVFDSTVALQKHDRHRFYS